MEAVIIILFLNLYVFLTTSLLVNCLLRHVTFQVGYISVSLTLCGSLSLSTARLIF